MSEQVMRCKRCDFVLLVHCVCLQHPILSLSPTEVDASHSSTSYHSEEKEVSWIPTEPLFHQTSDAKGVF